MKYVVSLWRGAYVTVGASDDFAVALAIYSTVAPDRTAQLVNLDRADSGRDGLTDEQRDQVAAVAYAEELASNRRSA